MMRFLPAICLVLAATSASIAEDGQHPDLDGVKPLFQQRCVECHGPIKPQAGLNLSNVASLALGGESGPPIVPGDLDASLIWQRIVDGEMPPDEPLPADELALVQSWIGAGARGLPDPDDPATQVEAVHWSFRPLTAPAVPPAGSESAARTDIDRFILSRLHDAGLSLSAEADRATLVQRVSLDLTGLPPTPAAIIAFQNDSAPAAYQRMVDGYLASPHYGIRWGKYWLDAAGYADSNGYFAADTDRPHAYRYRDWVIRSFNADKPYDEFVREQIAGDELVGYALGGDLTDEMIDPLTATQFLRNAPDGSGESDGNPDEVRIDRYTVLEGNLEIVMNCLLGVTIQCARCHDHKFEPVTHHEYYSLQAIFYGAYNPESWTFPNDRDVEVGMQAERESHHAQIAELDARIKALHDVLNSAAQPFRRELIRERLDPLDRVEVNAILAAWETPEQDRNEEQQGLVSAHETELNVSDDELAEHAAGFTKVQQYFQEQIEQNEQTRPAALPKIAVLVDTEKQPADYHVLIRGLHHQPGDVVLPGVPARFVLGDNYYQIDDTGLPTSLGRRLAFARWVTSPENPLFARTMVNRIWMHHFGNGLVTTPANLGLSGAPPSHRELLDYLATRFLDTGWSIKELHRAILGSAVYRQQSAPRDEGLRHDPDNRLLWRFSLRRLSAEAVRDAMLAKSGLLDEQMYGPYVPTQRRRDGLVAVADDHAGARRRSIFLQQRRTQMHSMLELFDAPAMLTSCPQRSTSTVPLQSLVMLNSEFVRECARAFGLRLDEHVGTDDDRRIEQSFLIAVGRLPVTEERRVAEEFLVKQRELYADAELAEQQVWADYCQMLLAGNASLYIE